jgi:gluconolactonase
MWSIRGAAPEVVRAKVLTRMPKEFRKPGPTAWANANKAGQEIDSFIEGPCFDRAGNLYIVDIPFGRIFRITPALEWSLVVQYDGWPNGLAIHKDGSIWIADYRKGLLRLDPQSGRIGEILAHRNSESFRGLNDLTFDREGNCYFTDQGQTGLHDPTGRVFRLRPSGQLDVVMSTVPSPNGLVVDANARALYVAVTRANQVWRGPMQRDGSISKVAAFQTFFGTSGPDGLALDVDNRLAMAHGSLGGAFVMSARGEVTHFIESPEGAMVTNLAYRPGTRQLVITESESGSILEADLPAAGLALFSHL